MKSLISILPEVNDPKKTNHGLQKMSVTCEEMAQEICRSPWSPIIFRYGIRRQVNFLSCEWAVFDFDDGLSLEEAKNLFKNLVHIIGTTRSHQKVKGGKVCDRFRVCLKYEEKVTKLCDYKYTIRKQIRSLGSDPACSDAARFFWPCTEVVSISSVGKCLEVLTMPKREPLKIRTCGGLPKSIERLLQFGAPDGQRNNTCFKVAISLLELGWNPDQVFERIMNSRIPLAKDGVSKEVMNVIASANRRLQVGGHHG